MQENTPHRTSRHVKLPGGRQIEVVYLDENLGSLSEELSSSAESSASAMPQTGSETPATRTSWTGNSPTAARTPCAGGSPATAPGEALHVCPRCAGGLVNPLDWVEESPGRWRILMRCPDCDFLREDVFGQLLVERLDEELDRATGALLDDLRQLTHANMVEEIEVFSRALQLDLIGPSDF